MPYVTDFNNAQNESLLKVIQQAIISTAIDIQVEAATVAWHQQRSMLAAQVLNSPDQYARLMAYAICAEGAVTPSSTDSQVKTRAGVVWNAFAISG